MSFRLVALVEDRVFASSTHKQVMFKLALSADDDGGNVRPSVWTIASDTQLSERTVRRVLKGFVELGLLTITREEDARHRLPKVYRIEKASITGLPLTEAATERARRRGERPHAKSHASSERVTEGPGSARNGCHPVRERGTDSPARGESVSPYSKEDSLEDSPAQTIDSSGQTEAEAASLPKGTSRLARDGGDRCIDDTLRKPRHQALWEEKTPLLREAIGKRDFDAWLSQASPEADDGQVYVMAVPNKFSAQTICAQYGKTIEKILGRKLILRLSFQLSNAIANKQLG